jgi:ATP-dependent DNA helicase RecG
MELVFFNQPFLKNRLVPGRKYLFYGKMSGGFLKKEMTAPVFEEIREEAQEAGKIVPVYALSSGLTQNMVRAAVSRAAAACLAAEEDLLPRGSGGNTAFGASGRRFRPSIPPGLRIAGRRSGGWSSRNCFFSRCLFDP